MALTVVRVLLGDIPRSLGGPAEPSVRARTPTASGRGDPRRRELLGRIVGQLIDGARTRDPRRTGPAGPRRCRRRRGTCRRGRPPGRFRLRGDRAGVEEGPRSPGRVRRAPTRRAPWSRPRSRRGPSPSSLHRPIDVRRRGGGGAVDLHDEDLAGIIDGHERITVRRPARLVALEEPSVALVSDRGARVGSTGRDREERSGIGGERRSSIHRATSRGRCGWPTSKIVCGRPRRQVDHLELPRALAQPVIEDRLRRHRARSTAWRSRSTDHRSSADPIRRRCEPSTGRSHRTVRPGSRRARLGLRSVGAWTPTRRPARPPSASVRSAAHPGGRAPRRRPGPRRGHR